MNMKESKREGSRHRSLQKFITIYILVLTQFQIKALSQNHT